MSKSTVVVGMILILIATPIAGAVGATSSPAAMTTQPTGDRIYDTNIDNISLWGGSVIPYRADLEAAETTVPLHDVRIKSPDGEIPANRNRVGVFTNGTAVPLELDSSDSASTSKHYAGEEVRVIVAEPDVDSSVEMTDLFALLDANDLSELNDNMTFTSIEETKVTSEGALEDPVTYDADSPGQYVTMVTTIEDGGNGLDVDNGDLVDAGESTIIGLDAFQVQEGPSTVTPSDADLGENVTFETTTGIEPGSGEVGQGIFLYDAAAFNDTSTILNVTADPSTNLSADNITLEPGVSGFNGDFRVDNETFENTTLAALNSSLVNESTTGGITLNASATAVATNSSNATIDVGTLEAWSDGTYRYVHVAADSSGDQLHTATGTVTLKASSSGGGGGGYLPPGGGGGGDGGDEPDNPKPTAVMVIHPESATVGEKITFSAAKSTDEEREIIAYEWKIDGDSYTGETVTTSFAEPGTYDVELTVRNDFSETDTVTDTVTVTEKDPGKGDGDGGDGDGGDGGDGDGGDGDGDDGDDGGSGPIPGFGVTVTLVALLAFAMLALRRQQ
ncbi:hypothetical protein HTG_00905 [Natrinema mahii]|nr:hypothetical protein HTG_00905 [Natrinema mahii]